MKKLLLTDITANLVGKRISGWLKQCEGGMRISLLAIYPGEGQPGRYAPCSALFIGAKDALYCSDRCRKGAKRDAENSDP